MRDYLVMRSDGLTLPISKVPTDWLAAILTQGTEDLGLNGCGEDAFLERVRIEQTVRSLGVEAGWAA